MESSSAFLLIFLCVCTDIKFYLLFCLIFIHLSCTYCNRQIITDVHSELGRVNVLGALWQENGNEVVIFNCRSKWITFSYKEILSPKGKKLAMIKRNQEQSLAMINEYKKMEKEENVAKNSFAVIQSVKMQNSAGPFWYLIRLRKLWWPFSFFFQWEGWKVISMSNRNVFHPKDSKSSPFLDVLKISLSVPRNPFTFPNFMWSLLAKHKYGMLNLCVSQATYSHEGFRKS